MNEFCELPKEVKLREGVSLLSLGYQNTEFLETAGVELAREVFGGR